MRGPATILLSSLLWFTAACAQEPLFPEVSEDADARFDGVEVTRRTLFGRPTDETGVSESCCTPSCAYVENGEEKVWTSPVYTTKDMQSLYYDWRLVGDVPEVATHDPTKVCAIVPLPELLQSETEPMPYALRTFDSSAQAAAAGAMITHTGTCGACSSLQNLAVYIANPDLSDPIRDCAVVSFFDRELNRLACIASLGFDLRCAQAWDANVRNTQSTCLLACAGSRRVGDNNLPYDCTSGFVRNDEDLLNPCLLCDEVFSIDVFRAAAGRARRNSGLPSPICRNCEGVSRIEHRYARPGQ